MLKILLYYQAGYFLLILSNESMSEICQAISYKDKQKYAKQHYK
jgi:hypothetical protein